MFNHRKPFGNFGVKMYVYTYKFDKINEEDYIYCPLRSGIIERFGM